MIDDPAVVKASEKFVRVIIRRPHVYELREKKLKDQSVPVPGIVFLNSEGKLIGNSRLQDAKELLEKLTELTR